MTLEVLIQDYIAQGGTLSEAALVQAGNTAWGYLTQQTMGRIRDCKAQHQELVLHCFQELVETIHGYAPQGRITRETVGDWTRAYDCGGVSPEETCRAIISRWLGETGLLYRGCPE